ncbi:toll/interleukin-1 receptor domain-containing protein [Sinorhizobium meliloti]|uniref:toll/interleukin-1 receptor domain-containing protein n=1 Tax=Rhizobium meliloti TaxID=382 RepID=UPI0013E33C84|nr:toll/interleukin-1 receptor domain-containing protein [Sinorhizobium meliloti]
MSETIELEKSGVQKVEREIRSTDRRLLFISHATPQDNLFAGWLSAQLAIAGYEVWCDLAKLLGGEAWWTDIDQAIDAAAFRVLFVSTLEANRKPGTLRELKLALDTQKKHGLKDFVVPLKIDEFPFASMDQSIKDLNCVRFDESWAKGLSNLLKLLEREGTPKSSRVGAATVTQWYKKSIDDKRKVVVSREKCPSNWFPFELPPTIFFHQFRGPADTLLRVASQLDVPHRVLGSYIATFAPFEIIADRLGPHFSATELCSTATFVEDGFRKLGIEAFDAMNVLSDMVRQAWDHHMSAQDFAFHEMANRQKAWFFKNGQLAKNRGHYMGSKGKRAFRQLVGNKTRKKLDGSRISDGFWHYAVSVSPQLAPFPRLVLKHHVIFTDDGQTPWSAPDRMHRARRTVCKNWWNAEWRDRLRAFTAELGAGASELSLPLGGSQALLVAMEPMEFTSPWTFFEEGREGLDETKEIELVEEDEGDEDEEA